MIVITSKRGGFRRAGRAHPATPTSYPDDAFTSEQLAALQAEPMLIVRIEPDTHTTRDDGDGGAKTPAPPAGKPAAKGAKPKAEG